MLTTPLDMVGPLLQRGALLCGELVPLINTNNPGERTRDMVQDLLDNDKVRAQPRHPAGARSSQVVHRPWGDADRTVEAFFGLEAVIGRGAGANTRSASSLAFATAVS